VKCAARENLANQQREDPPEHHATFASDNAIFPWRSATAAIKIGPTVMQNQTVSSGSALTCR
jgi:hypothetical protein